MDRIVGQTRALDVLQAALAAGRVHHAFIFHGPAGVGKFTTALAFAKVLLCHDAQPDLAGRVTACGHCVSCRLLRAGALADDEAATGHPDLHIVTKELARYSDDKAIRERKLITIPVDVLSAALIEPVYRSAQLRHHKVFIVDEAELIRDDGQNKLLKTLEEPPAGTFLILVTANEDRLLPTIRSRCQRVAFVPLADDVLARWLDANGERLLAETRARAQQQAEQAKARATRDEDDEDEPQAKSKKKKKEPILLALANLPATLTPPHRHWLIQFAAGSFGRMDLALRYNLYHWAKLVLPALEEFQHGRYALELGRGMAEGLDDFAESWVREHKNASKEAANKQAAGLMWALISQHARQKLAETAGHVAGADVLAAEAALAPWLGVLDAVEEAQRDVAANVNLGLATDRLMSLLWRALRPKAAGAGRERAG